MKRTRTLRREMLRFLLLGWFIPLTALIIILMFGVSSRMNSEIERTLSISAEKATELVHHSLDDCISESRDASYISTIRDAWSRYQKTGNSGTLRSTVTLFLEEKYKFHPSFNRTVLIFTSEPESIYYAENESALKRLQPIRYFQSNVRPQILEIAADLDTGIRFVKLDGRTYMIRNLVDRSFTPYAVIAMELNVEDIFGSLRSIPEYEAMVVSANEKELTTNGEASERASTLTLTDRVEGNAFTYEISYDRNALKLDQRSAEIVFLIFLVFLIPLVAVVFTFFHTRVTRPITELTEASKKIAEGKYGETVPTANRNDEIADLTDNFNRMSEKLNEQFNKIFVEEIALRDANIHALQSQINPHFLNNTLEIINWETRLSGDEKASRMIEALSTMMGATMDREKRPMVFLEEELSYVHAFQFILSCRYGEKFTYEEKIDDKLLRVEVPRLIIQPVVENAAEHGVDSTGHRYVGLFIEGSPDDLTIRVVNRGIPMREDWERINALLSEKETEETHALGIGIRNVHRRLRMLYGEESGLSIKTDVDGNTISTITIRREG